MRNSGKQCSQLPCMATHTFESDPMWGFFDSLGITVAKMCNTVHTKHFYMAITLYRNILFLNFLSMGCSVQIAFIKLFFIYIGCK